MPTYVIEREMPGVGHLGPDELAAADAASRAVLEQMPDLTWHQSFLTGDKLYCLYEAPDVESVREHARRAGLPVHDVRELRERVGPGTLPS